MLAVIHGEVVGPRSWEELAWWLGGMSLILLIIGWSEMWSRLVGFLDGVANPDQFDDHCVSSDSRSDALESSMADQPFEPMVEP